MLFTKRSETQGVQIVDHVTIAGPWFMRNKLKTVLTGCAESLIKNKNKIYVNEYSTWEAKDLYTVKTFDDIILSEDVESSIMLDLNMFLNSSELYQRCRISRKRAYLFHGPPGTGKTSLAKAIAHYTGWKLYMMDLATIGTGKEFKRLMEEVPPQSVILIDDVDLADLKKRDLNGNNHENSDQTDQNRLKLSTVLTVLDGHACLHETIVVFTSNRPEALDSALIRAGRIDMKVFIGPYDRATATKMLRKMSPDLNEEDVFDGVIFPVKPAEIQEIIFRKTIQHENFSNQ
jgi:mitochondrial chaperone BCS1